MDEIISIFTTRTSYPILCEDTRDLIITEVLNNNKKKAGGPSLLVRREELVACFYSCGEQWPI